MTTDCYIISKASHTPTHTHTPKEKNGGKETFAMKLRAHST